MLSRKAYSIILLAALAGPLALNAASDPFLGTWELDLTASSITRGAPPRSETIVTTPEPGGFRCLLAVVNEKSTSVEVQHFNFDGAFHMTEGSDPRQLSVKRASRNVIEQDTRRNGNITVHRRIEVSRDGKTLTFIANGTSGNGTKYVNDTRVYQKR